MDIREVMAREIAGQIEAEVLGEKCDKTIGPGVKCRWPLMRKKDQLVPFCWGCATDARNASKGRDRWLSAQGIIVGDDVRQQVLNPPE